MHQLEQENMLRSEAQPALSSLRIGRIDTIRCKLLTALKIPTALTFTQTNWLTKPSKCSTIL